MQHFFTHILCSFCFLAIAGCAQLHSGQGTAPITECNTGLNGADDTRLAAIEQMVTEGKIYAAIAQLDGLNLSVPKAQLIRANALRRTDKSEQAVPIYEMLLNSCYAGHAYHGLGLILMRRGDHATGLMSLRSARTALPTVPDVRNDYGYALLLAGNLDDAQFEFLTALDLDPAHPRAGRNAVMLLLRKGEPTKAEALARQFGLDQSTMDKLKLQASELQQDDSAPGVPAL